MQTKRLIYICIFVFSTLGGWLGSLVDHGNIFGIWSLGLGVVGAFVGVWAGFRLGNL